MSTAAPVEGLADQFVPGTMLGKYELLATIGRGGMANVILARQHGPAGFEKIAVIKVIHPHMAQDKRAVTMLHDEARVAAQIDHPNVVHTYELGEAHGTFYIVMEYLAGESFNHVLRRHATEVGPLDPNIAARIVADAANGLHAAHELTTFEGKSLEIVHRDVSPGNIVVLYNGNVKVVDFGIAKAQGRVTSTQDGELKGKYGYMSPEQIKNEPMDRRSDVFSLGVVLWEALSTQRLFKADNVAATLMQIISSPRVPPSKHDPRVSPMLDAIALKALSIAPADRFQTCGEMKQAIEDATWQSRVGAKEVEAHMKLLFAERMEQRRSLLSRASRGSFNDSDLEIIGTVFKEGSQTTVPPRDVTTKAVGASTPAPMPQAPKKRAPWLVLGLLLLAGGGAGAYYVSTRESEKPPAVAAASPSNPTSDVTKPDVAKPDVTKPDVANDVTKPDVANDVTNPDVTKPDVAKPDVAKPEEPKPEEPKPITKPKHKPADHKPADHKPAPTTNKPSGTSAADLYKDATALYMKGDFIGAEAGYKRALAADRKYAPAHRGLGFLYQRSGNSAKAIESLRTYLKLSPDAKDAASVRQRIEQMGG